MCVCCVGGVWRVGGVCVVCRWCGCDVCVVCVCAVCVWYVCGVCSMCAVLCTMCACVVVCVRVYVIYTRREILAKKDHTMILIAGLLLAFTLFFYFVVKIFATPI